MNPSNREEKVTQVFKVRDRPVGFQSGRWGGALVAVERGEFPISPTGFRSLSGAGEAAVTPALLESLAIAHERERESVLRRMLDARQPVGIPIMNFIHVSCAYEQGIQYGFFANDRDRRELWGAAHQLLCLVDADSRFQPVPKPTFVAWTPAHCEESLERSRTFKDLLARLATGEFPVQMPPRLLGVNAYLALPPKPAGEPQVELPGYTAEMALQVPVTSPAQRLRSTRAAAPALPTEAGRQLGLFDSPSVAAKAVGPDAPRSRLGTRC